MYALMASHWRTRGCNSNVYHSTCGCRITSYPFLIIFFDVGIKIVLLYSFVADKLLVMLEIRRVPCQV